jgi:hypothetical protein
MLNDGRSRVRVLMKWMNFFNLPNPFSPTVAPGPTQPLTEMSSRRYFWGKTRPARKANNAKRLFCKILNSHSKSLWTRSVDETAVIGRRCSQGRSLNKGLSQVAFKLHVRKLLWRHSPFCHGGSQGGIRCFMPVFGCVLVNKLVYRFWRDLKCPFFCQRQPERPGNKNTKY